MLSDDYNEVFGKVCTILEANDEFVKFSFKDKKYRICNSDYVD